MNCTECISRILAAPSVSAEIWGRVRWFVVGVFLISITGGTAPASAQAVTLTPLSLELGTYLIGSDDPLQGTVKITNHTGETLRLRQVKVSCGCLRVIDSFDAVDAGATQTMKVEVRPESGPERVSVKTLSIRLEGEQTHQEMIKVRWSEVHPIVAEPEKLVFAKMDAGESRTASVKLQIADPKEGERLSIKSVHATYPFVETNVVDDAQIQVHVRLPDAFESARNAELVIDVESTHRSFPKLRLPLLVARIPLPILASPSTIVLFQKPPAEGKKVRVRVFDRDRKPLHVTSIRIESGDGASGAEAAAAGESAAELLPGTVSNRSKADIKVTILPAKPGSRQKLIIQFKDSSRDRIEIPIYHAYGL